MKNNTFTQKIGEYLQVFEGEFFGTKNVNQGNEKQKGQNAGWLNSCMSEIKISRCGSEGGGG